MRSHHLLMPFLGIALITAPALAQPGQTTHPSPQTSAGGLVTQLQTDQWRASDLEGLDVYSSNNGDKIGNIDDIVLDSSGKVRVIVIAVGAYLGLGERDIAVPFNQIRFETQPRGTGTITGEARLAGASPGGGTVTSPAATGTAAVPTGSNSRAASNTPAPGTPGASGLGRATPAGSGSTPNHAVLMMSVTKDDLRTAPEFTTNR